MKKLSVIIPVYNQEILVIKALDSIPNRKDIEIIVIDDASTDNTRANLLDYIKNSSKDIILLYNEENKGLGYTANRGYDTASGEYIVLLDSDDYFITNEFEKCLDELDGTDLIYFDLRINNGNIIRLTPKTKEGYPGEVKFMRKDFIGETRCPNIRRASDRYFYQELLKKQPTEKFTNKVIKHYNFPRVGSLSYLTRNGMWKYNILL